MEKLVDVRCYVSQDLKRRIKLHTLNNNISVNRWLLKLIEDNLNCSVPEVNMDDVLNSELQEILLKLSNSANLPSEEREGLKGRKKQIKNMLKGVTNNE